jgi:hypothetical protein
VLPAQIASSLPALTVAALLNVNTIISVADKHDPAPSGSSVVIISITDPAVVSAFDGVYVAFKRAVLLNVPLPEVDQVELVALDPIEPLSITLSVAQMVVSFPALEVGGGIFDITAAEKKSVAT